MLTPDEACLKLDIDRRRRVPDLFVIRRKCERAGYRVEGIAVRRSPSGRGWHVWVHVVPTPATLTEVVALQAICGSDPWREAATLYRAMRAWDTESRRMANVLYTPSTFRQHGRMPR